MSLEAYYADEAVKVYASDNRAVISALPDASVDACVTDPPYELAFMGRKWDASGVAYDVDLWRDVLRVLKPGGHLLAFGGTRTWHRLACAIEDAGFEVRDSIAWMYGSGFPKSLDVSKAIDKANGRQFEDRYALGRHIRECREECGYSRSEVNAWFGYADGCEHWERQDRHGARVPTLADFAVLQQRLGLSDDWRDLVQRVEAERKVIGKGISGTTAIWSDRGMGDFDITTPATPAAQQWQGWGTALKPAFEPVVVARKPLVGTVAENVLRWGTGAMNVDASRIATDDRFGGGAKATSGFVNGYEGDGWTPGSDKGRWPSNVILDESQAAELDRQSGVSTSQGGQHSGRSGTRGDVGDYGFDRHVINRPTDEGGASRFFYVPKADSNERPRVDGTAHPTVKPLDLMRYLVRLITPPGGTVLEPFAGSGTTAEACVVEGFNCIAIEREPDYLPLILQRLRKPIEPVMF